MPAYTSRPRRTVDDDEKFLDVFFIVLSHLNEPDGNEQLYHKAARKLHLVSRSYHAAARATLRHLCLTRYYKGIRAMYSNAANRPSALPMELLAACPSVTSWSLDFQQLKCFEGGLDEVVATAAAKLKRIKAHPLCYGERGLGQLLKACNRLEELSVTGDIGMPWLLLAPNSTSYTNAVAPALPLRSWASHCLPQQIITRWVAQQPQLLGSTFKRLHMSQAGPTMQDLTGLAALTGLQDLDLSFLAPEGLGNMTSLTSLVVPGRPNMMDAVVKLVNLRELSLPCGTLTELPDSMAALQQLTRLSMCITYIKELPTAMGAWLPRLERLAVKECEVAAVPASLTGLSHLDFSSSSATHLTLPASLAGLQELVVRSSKQLTSIQGLHYLSGLSLLDASYSAALGTSLAPLQSLSRLRHLNVMGVAGLDPGSFTVLGGLQQLTSLQVGSTTAECWEALAAAGAPPALQQLRVTIVGEAPGVAGLEPCLVQWTALTRLHVTGAVMAGDEMTYLPAQLQQLSLVPPNPFDGLQQMPGGLQQTPPSLWEPPPGLQQLPRGLQRLSALEFLDVSGHGGLSQLPSWLSQLRCLEIIALDRTGVETQQEVLAQMPGLRCVSVSGFHAATVYGSASHLHFEDTARLWQHQVEWN